MHQVEDFGRCISLQTGGREHTLISPKASEGALNSQVTGLQVPGTGTTGDGAVRQQDTGGAGQGQEVSPLREHKPFGLQFRLTFTDLRLLINNHHGVVRSPDESTAFDHPMRVLELLKPNVALENNPLPIVNHRDPFGRNTQIGLIAPEDQSSRSFRLNGATVEVIARFRAAQFPVATAILPALAEVE